MKRQRVNNSRKGGMKKFHATLIICVAASTNE